MSEKYLGAFISGRYDARDEKRVIKAGLASTVGFQQVLDNPATYDTLPLADLAQAGELFFKVLGLTLAATSPTDKAVDHVVAEFYKNLFHNYSAALRSNEPEESFVTMAPAFVRLILDERLALTRSTYSLGAETSMAALMAALTLIWAIMPDFEKLATTARTTADQSTGGHQTSRYQSGSVGSDRCGYIDRAQPASKQEDLRQEEQLERAAGNTKQVVKPVASKLTQPAKSQVAMMSWLLPLRPARVPAGPVVPCVVQLIHSLGLGSPCSHGPTPGVQRLQIHTLCVIRHRMYDMQPISNLGRLSRPYLPPTT